MTRGTPNRNKNQGTTIESFDIWLEAWTIYENLLLEKYPTRHKELSRYRDIIHKANRKYLWSSVYSYDVHFHLNAALDPDTRLDVLDTTLFTTLLNSSPCQRCKSPDYLICDCPFCAKSAMEENQSSKKSGTCQSTWKFEKWFTDTGNEGCNLFQRNACNQGKECKRAHVCKACRGTTLFPIASSFPPVDSPLNLPCWVQSLTYHLNRTLVNELLRDITQCSHWLPRSTTKTHIRQS